MSSHTKTFSDEFPYEYMDFLGKLEEEPRFVVMSFYGLAGKPKLSLEEIAEVLRDPGLHTNTVRNTLATAMAKLREEHDLAKLKAFNAREKTASS